MKKIIVMLISLMYCCLLVGCGNVEQQSKFRALEQENNILRQESTTQAAIIKKFEIREQESLNTIKKYEKDIAELDEQKMALEEKNKALENNQNDISQVREELFQMKKASEFWKYGMINGFSGKTTMKSKTESVAGTYIGDSLADLIDKFGYEFAIWFSDDGFDPIIFYDGISFSINANEFCVTEIYLSDDTYETSLGSKVGDNAVKVFNEYRKHYMSNEEGLIHPEYPKWLFDLGEGFVIQFKIDTDELNNESKITHINIRNFYHGEI